MKGVYGVTDKEKDLKERCIEAIKADGIDLISLEKILVCRAYEKYPTSCYIPLIHDKDIKKMQKKSDSFIVKVSDGGGFIVYFFGVKKFFEAHEMDAVKEYMIGKLKSALTELPQKEHGTIQ